MPRYAVVAVNVPVHQTFHYHIMETWPTPPIGALVQVSFGTSVQPGIIVEYSDESPVPETKPLLALLDPLPVVSQMQISLARWMSDTYLTPLGQCLWLMLPPGIAGYRTKRVTLIEQNASSDDPLEHRIIEMLRRRGALLVNQIKASSKSRARTVDTALKHLERQGIIEMSAALSPPTVRARYSQTARLAIPPQAIQGIARHLGRDSRRARLLEVIAACGDEGIPVQKALKLAEVRRNVLTTLINGGTVEIIEGMARLALPPEAVDEALIDLREGYKQLRALELLAKHGTMSIDEIREQSGIKSTDIKRLAEDGLIEVYESPIFHDVLAHRDFIPKMPPVLTPAQEEVWKPIEAQVKAWQWGNAKGHTFLLHGVTGSGKTEIYLKAIQQTLAQGRDALFLVPEIALTPQTIQRVAERFPGQVAVIHGSLKPRERYDTWQRIRRGLVKIVVGARSAIFAPLADIGLIILDEEHDHSYKQTPPISPPYYHTREIAEQLAKLQKAVVLLGSATPDVETFYRAERGAITYLHLPERIMGHRGHITALEQETGMTARYRPTNTDEAMAIDLPPVDIVDMREELKSGNRSMFSRALQAAIDKVLQEEQQAILYLNRRGQASYVFCRDCGYVARCPRCDTPLTFHRVEMDLQCHHCDYRGAQPSTCPECGSKRIKYFGAGTQQVEAEVKKHWPQARVLRWDADTASNMGDHETILEQFRRHEADIIVGTQMIAKGLDLPLVTLVGVVSADVGLALPDFRAGERVFQLLMQVAGRAGRGVLGGRAILQTYQPQHYAIRAAAAHDYMGFYRQEIAYRHNLGYPPFRRMARLLIQSSNPQQAQNDAEYAARALRQQLERTEMTGSAKLIGPVPCFFSRIDRYYRWQVILRAIDIITPFRELDIHTNWYLILDPLDVL